MGILLSAGVLRACVGLEGTLGYRLPFSLQWIWPAPLFVCAFFCPESPWNSIRRNRPEEAKKNLMRLRSDSPNKEAEVDATIAYIRHTTELEKAETEGASIVECFKGVNLRRTEIVSTLISQSTGLTSAELPCLDVSDLGRQPTYQLCCRLSQSSGFQRGAVIQPEHGSQRMLRRRSSYLLSPLPVLWKADDLHVWSWGHAPNFGHSMCSIQLIPSND